MLWRTGIDIPPRTKIGYGFYIAHGQSIVVNPLTVIGDDAIVADVPAKVWNFNTPGRYIGNKYESKT